MQFRFPRLAAALAGATVLLSACGSSGGDTASGASGKASLKVACSASVQQIPRDLAVKEKLDQKEGITQSCIQVQTGPNQAAALISGDINVAIFTASLLTPLLDKKQDLVVVGRMWDVNNFDILVRKGVSLPHQSEGWKGTMQDLKGKRIGVVARGAAAEAVARALFEEAGMSPDSATYIPTGLPNTTLASLQSNAIDAAITFEPGITLALDQGIATQPFSLAKGTGPKDMVYSDLLITASRSYAEKNKGTLCKFLKSWDAGLNYMRDPANSATVEKETQTFLGLKPNQAKALLENNRSYFPETTALDAAKINPGFAFQKKYGTAQTTYTVDKVGVDVCS